MNPHEFPVLDAYFRWARHQHETGKKTADELVAAAIQRYGSAPTVLESLVRETLRLVAIEAIAGRSPLADIEDDTPRATIRAVEDGAEERARISARRRAEIIRIAQESVDNPVVKFFERHPSHGVTIPLLAMTREELIDAADSRDAESKAAMRRAVLCRRLAEKLQPGQIAGDVFTEEEVERIAKKLKAINGPQDTIRRAG
jgi:hypothetical protein